MLCISQNYTFEFNSGSLKPKKKGFNIPVYTVHKDTSGGKTTQGKLYKYINLQMNNSIALSDVPSRAKHQNQINKQTNNNNFS